MKSKPILILGQEVSFERRRYYGKQTFTWAYLKHADGTFESLGDPWPCVTPKRSELETEIRRMIGGNTR